RARSCSPEDMMSFVIDANDWNFAGLTAAQLVDALDGLLDRISVAHERDETVWIGDDLQTRAVLGQDDLWSLLGPNSPIILPDDLWQRITAWLLHAPRYLDEDNWPV